MTLSPTEFTDSPTEITASPAGITAGGLKLANALWLAPLAGVTTPPVREFFSRLGAGLTHTEMVSCMGLTRGNRKTETMLALPDTPGAPVVLQLFSGDADSMRQGADAALSMNARQARRFAALGVNMACPMPKVTKRGAGAALMSTPETAFSMVRGLKPLGLPVWVKIRRFSDKPDKPDKQDMSDTLRFIDGLIEAGADNVCVHGRTPAQRYEGKADRLPASEAASRFPGKISASGDVYTADDVKEYLAMGCVGVMLARGALANPYLFPQALRALGYGVPDELANPAPRRRIDDLIKFAGLVTAASGPRMALFMTKRLMPGMLKGTPGFAELRRHAAAASDIDELLYAVNHFQ